jgi:hypothetical protein
MLLKKECFIASNAHIPLSSSPQDLEQFYKDIHTFFGSKNEPIQNEVNHITKSDFNYYWLIVNQIFERNSQFGCLRLGLNTHSMKVKRTYLIEDAYPLINIIFRNRSLQVARLIF